jgi:hypothetical protein
MNGTMLLHTGARFVFDGEIVEVIELDGPHVTLRDATDRWRAVSLTRFVEQAVSPIDPRDSSVNALAAGSRLHFLTKDERSALHTRADHVREVLTGFRSGSPHKALPQLRGAKLGA